MVAVKHTNEPLVELNSKRVVLLEKRGETQNDVIEGGALVAVAGIMNERCAMMNKELWNLGQ